MVSSDSIPSTDGIFRRDGAGDRALVFLHGFPDDQHVWNAVIAELTAPDFEIVRLELAGFGDRSSARGPFTYDRFASDLAAVVDVLDKPFVLVGHSMAAPIVELVAAARPDRAIGVVLLAPIPMAGPRLPDEVMEKIRSLGDGGREAFRNFYRRGAPLALESEVERLVTVATTLRPVVVRAVADVWNNGHPAGERPSGFAGPVLVLQGGDDTLVTAEVIASAVVARFDSSKTTVCAIESSTHRPHLEQPFAVAREINVFLAGLTI